MIDMAISSKRIWKNENVQKKTMANCKCKLATHNHLNW